MTASAAPLAIAQIDLQTSDLDRCCDFYTGLLGLRQLVVLRQTEAPHHRHALLQVGDSPSILHVLERPHVDPADGPRLGLLVADRVALDAVAERLRAVGASDGVVHHQGPTWAVTYRDPDGLEGDVRAANPDFAPSAADRCQVVG